MRLPLEAVAIVGPTASGKSSLAERVAAELHTSIVSVDAMQVYRGMDIGTAKSLPTTPGVELLMVDVADISQDYSVSLFQRDARVCVDGLLTLGFKPVSDSLTELRTDDGSLLCVQLSRPTDNLCSFCFRIWSKDRNFGETGVR